MEDLIKSLISQHTKLKDSDLNTLLSQSSSSDLNSKVQSINNLLLKGTISITEESGEIVYSLLSDQQISSLKKLSPEDLLILQIVRESGDKGTWNAEIKQKTQIPIPQIGKILTSLEKKGLVFFQKSVSHNKKLWFIEGTTPNAEVTGGFLFADSGFDKNLMSELCTQVKLLLSDKISSLKEILSFMKANVNKNMTEENIKEVLNSMIALGEVEERNGKFKSNKEFFIDPLVVPCFACRFRSECQPGGVINPSDCEYLNSWLEF